MKKVSSTARLSFSVKHLTLAAILAALSVVFGLFLAISYPGGGYFSFGDVFLFLGAFLLPLPESLLTSLVAGILLDSLTGSFVYLPFTVVAKLLLTLPVSLAFTFGKEKKILAFFASILGTLLQCATYFIAYYLYLGLGGCINTLFDLIQGGGCLLLAFLFYLPLKQIPFLNPRP